MSDYKNVKGPIGDNHLDTPFRGAAGNLIEGINGIDRAKASRNLDITALELRWLASEDINEDGQFSYHDLLEGAKFEASARIDGFDNFSSKQQEQITTLLALKEYESASQKFKGDHIAIIPAKIDGTTNVPPAISVTLTAQNLEKYLKKEYPEIYEKAAASVTEKGLNPVTRLETIIRDMREINSR